MDADIIYRIRTLEDRVAELESQNKDLKEAVSTFGIIFEHFHLSTSSYEPLYLPVDLYDRLLNILRRQ